MKWRDLFAEKSLRIFEVTVVAVGTFGVFAQVYYASNSLDAQAYSSISQTWHEHLVSLANADNKSIRACLLGIRPEACALGSQEELDAMADLHLDAMDRVLVSARIAGWNDEDVGPWKRLFQGYFERSLYLCRKFSVEQSDFVELAKDVVPQRCKRRE